MTDRPVRTERVSMRVYPETKRALHELRDALAARALHASERELVEAFIARGLQLAPEDIESLIRSHRATAP